MEVTKSSNMIPQSVDMLSQWCKDVLLEISSHSLLHWKGSVSNRSKVLLVANTTRKSIIQSFRDCLVCEIIVTNACELSHGNIHWYIHIIGNGSLNLYEYRDGGKYVNLGDGLELINHTDLRLSSEDTIWELIDLVIFHMTHGWEKKTLDEFPDIPSDLRCDEATWSLYVKKSFLRREEILIRCLRGIYLMEDDMECDRTETHVYMWIRREKMGTFIQKFWPI